MLHNRLVQIGVVTLGILVGTQLAVAQLSPPSWEMLDRSRPIVLQPWALVCRTIQQAEVAGLTENERGPGCIKPRESQHVRVTWLGSGPGEYERYQHVLANFGGRMFDGWMLGVDLRNE